jgi:hypothetical protein
MADSFPVRFGSIQRTAGRQDQAGDRPDARVGAGRTASIAPVRAIGVTRVGTRSAGIRPERRIAKSGMV